MVWTDERFILERNFDMDCRFGLLAGVLAAGLFAGTGMSNASLSPSLVSPDQQTVWVRHLLPLPKEIELPRKVTLNPAEVRVQLRPTAGSIERTAADQLIRLLGGQSAKPSKAAFTIVIGVLDDQLTLNGIRVPDGKRLRTLKNKDQAYLIRPHGEDALVIAALDEKGVYYGVQTLTQLIAPFVTEKQISIPLAVVTDWPDMSERGHWNIGWRTPGLLVWMSRLKLNFTTNCVGIEFKKDAVIATEIPTDLIREAHDHAFTFLVHPTHLNFFGRSAAYKKFYPSLTGKGDSALYWGYKRKHYQSDIKRCPCASNPLLTKVLTEWIVSAASQGALDIDLWLSEYWPAQCGCEQCMKNGPRQFQLETKACVDAIHAASKQYPELKGRIFFTFGIRARTKEEREEQDRDAAESLALVPDDIRAELAYGAPGRLKPYDNYVADGHWASSFVSTGAAIPGVLHNGLAGLRFHCSEEGLINRLGSFIDNHWSAAYPMSAYYAPYDVKGYGEKVIRDYFISAYAEWTWNNHGRDPRQFRLAWLTQHQKKYGQPEQALAWVDMMQPIESVLVDRVYHSSRLCFQIGKRNRGSRLFLALRDNNPELLRQVWKEMPSLAEFDEMLGTTEQAYALAKRLDNSRLMDESLYAAACIRLIKALRGVSDAICAPEGAEPAASPEASLKQVRDAIETMIDVLNRQVDADAEQLTEPYVKYLKKQHADALHDFVEKIAEATGGPKEKTR